MYTAKGKKNYYHRVALVYTAKKKKLIGCLVGLGNLRGTQWPSGVTGRVKVTSIYTQPSLGTGFAPLQPPLHW